MQNAKCVELKLMMIKQIGEGSTTANSLPHVARIADEALQLINIHQREAPRRQIDDLKGPPMTKELKQAAHAALEALEEIALAGMSGTGQESEEGLRDWHARQAWKFIGIAARELEPLRRALALRPAAQTEREAFEAWFDDYYDKACAEFGGIDCTDPKGIAEEAWQARASLPTQPAAQATPEPVGDFFVLDDDAKAMIVNSHHYTPENIRALIEQLKSFADPTKTNQADWDNLDWRGFCNVLWRVMMGLSCDLPTQPAAQATPAQEPCQHVLYETTDADRPTEICDRNGEVVLAMCKLCSKAEAELETPQPAAQATVELVDEVQCLLRTLRDYEGNPVPINKRSAMVRALQKAVDGVQAVTQPAQQATPEPVGEVAATVAEVHMGRYTLEWNGKPYPEGTKLYTRPAPGVPEDVQREIAAAQAKGGQ